MCVCVFLAQEGEVVPGEKKKLRLDDRPIPKIKKTPPKPIKRRQLDLDELPPELLPRHHEYILEQVTFVSVLIKHCHFVKPLHVSLKDTLNCDIICFSLKKSSNSLI